MENNIDDEIYAPIDLKWSEDDDAKLKITLEVKQKYPYNWGSYLKKHYNDIYEWLQHRHPLLEDKKYVLSTKLYWLQHKFVFFQPCPICKKTKNMHRNIDSFEKGYFRACCKECADSNPRTKEKRKNTCIEKYGCSSFLGSQDGKNKRNAWCAKHGVKNPFQLESVKKKSRESRKSHFGYEYTMQSPKKRDLAKQNYRNKTGYDHQFCDPSIKQKIKATQQHNLDSGIDPKKKFKENWRIRRYNEIASLSTEVVPRFSLEYFMQFDREGQYQTPFDWHCNKCGKDFSAYLDQNLIAREHLPARCLHCHPILNGTSSSECEIYEFLKNEYGEKNIKQHDRSILHPYELDIVVEDKKIGIEYNGLFYHSETSGGKTKMYHLFKTEEAEKKGYHVIHIFEDEWLYKKQIVKSRLKSVLGIPDKKIWARKCIVSNIDGSTAKRFLDENHIQGWCKSKINIGLFYENELVALMTFGKPRFNKKYEWELLRFCAKTNVQVVGGASKLLKAFERHIKPKNLLSYADRRWSYGKLYESIGFSLDHVSGPNFWYIHNKNGFRRLSRVKFQKHRLKNILNVFDGSKTEIENMRLNGYDRIFDCGNLVYVKNY